MSALKSMHWQELKKLMEARGLKWENKAQAIEALGKLETAEANASKPDSAPEVKAPKGVDVTLDKSKPYGTVHGKDDRFPDAAFSQGGRYFNRDGNQVGK